MPDSLIELRRQSIVMRSPSCFAAGASQLSETAKAPVPKTGTACLVGFYRQLSEVTIMMVTNRGELTIGNIARARRMARWIMLRIARPFQFLMGIRVLLPRGAVMYASDDYWG